MARRTLAMRLRDDRDLLLVDGHGAAEALAEGRRHDTQVVDDQRRLRHRALEVLVAVHGVHLVLASAQQRETSELASVRLQQAHLEALDAPVGLQLPVQLDGLVEDVERTVLPSAYDLAPADEKAGISHVILLGSGFCASLTAQQPSARAITICWTSSVPSPIVRILASR